jgi:hypothetical protein
MVVAVVGVGVVLVLAVAGAAAWWAYQSWRARDDDTMVSSGDRLLALTQADEATRMLFGTDDDDTATKASNAVDLTQTADLTPPVELRVVKVDDSDRAVDDSGAETANDAERSGVAAKDTDTEADREPVAVVAGPVDVAGEPEDGEDDDSDGKVIDLRDEVVAAEAVGALFDAVEGEILEEIEVPDDDAVVIDLSDRVNTRSMTRRRSLKPEPEGEVDEVVRALIDRVRSSKRDLVAVVSEIVEHDLDHEQMEIVLTQLVEKQNRSRPRQQELVLSGDDVPARPGRLSAFADMSEAERRRVIIRVLCLLVARDDRDADASTVIDLRDGDAATDVTTSRDVWPDEAVGSDGPSLPARRRLLRGRR